MTSVFEYYGHCLTKKYATTKGRASREEYNAFLMMSVLTLLSFLGGLFLSILVEVTYLSFALTGAFCLWALVSVIPFISVSIRRLHDVGFHGMFVIFLFWMPLFAFLLIIEEGDEGFNEYGEEPRGYGINLCQLPAPEDFDSEESFTTTRGALTGTQEEPVIIESPPPSVVVDVEGVPVP